MDTTMQTSQTTTVTEQPQQQEQENGVKQQEPAPAPAPAPQTSQNYVFSSLFAVIHAIISIFAIYLSFKCNNGFSFFPFLAALFLPYLYLLYVIAVQRDCLNDVLGMAKRVAQV